MGTIDVLIGMVLFFKLWGQPHEASLKTFSNDILVDAKFEPNQIPCNKTMDTNDTTNYKYRLTITKKIRVETKAPEDNIQ